MTYEPRWIRELRRLPGGARVIAKYQKPKAEGVGERLPDFVHVTGHEHFRLDQPKPRAYVKCIWTDGTPSWWYCDPLGHWGMLADALVAEHEDGTISARGTINNHGPYEPWWRGTLLKGVWAGHAIYPEKSHAVE